MGKVKKEKTSRINLDKGYKPIALEDQLSVNVTARPTGRNKQRSSEKEDDEVIT